MPSDPSISMLATHVIFTKEWGKAFAPLTRMLAQPRGLAFQVTKATRTSTVSPTQSLWQKRARSNAKPSIQARTSTYKDSSAELLLTDIRMPHGTQLDSTCKRLFRYSKAGLTDPKPAQPEEEHRHQLEPISELHGKRAVMPSWCEMTRLW